MKSILTASALLLAAFQANAEKLTVAVANYPLYYFTERIAGDSIDIYYPIPADEDPAFWKPKAEEVTEYQKADLIIMNGATYSKWAETVSLPEDKIINTSTAFEGAYIIIEGASTHTHGDGEEHSHDGVAFTTWLDMKQSIKQAHEIKDALISTAELDEKTITTNFEQLEKDLLEIDKQYQEASDSLSIKSFIASHPIYQYWSRAYNLTVAPLVWEPEMKLSKDDLKDLKKLQGEHSEAKYFIWEGQPSDENAKHITSSGLKNIIIQPSFSKPEEGDFLSVMRANVEQLRSAK